MALAVKRVWKHSRTRSWQLPIDTKTGAIPEYIVAQTEASLKNVSAILEASGTSLEKAVKMTVFVWYMNDFGKINAVYENFFKGDAPARSLVRVARLPKDAGDRDRVHSCVVIISDCTQLGLHKFPIALWG